MKNFNALFVEFQKLEKDEMAEIIGGDDLLDGLFSQTFKFEKNVTADAITVFKKQVIDLNSTGVGHDMLVQLYNSHGVVSIDGSKPHNSNSAIAEFVKTENKIYIGNLDTKFTDPYYNEGLNFAVITHELFHAELANTIYSGYATNASEAYLKDVRSEIDATVFAYMASVQYDVAHNLSISDGSSHIRNAVSLVKPDPKTASEIAVKNAWNDIFFNGKFNKENFNILEANFSTGTTYTSNTGKSTNPLKYDTESNVSYIFLNHDGFIRDTKLLKSMFDDSLAHPIDIMKAHPDIRNVPSPLDQYNPNTGGQGGSGGGGGGGNGGSPIYNPYDPIWSNPYNGYTPTTDPNYGGYVPPTWFDGDGSYHPEWGPEGNQPY